MRAPILVGIDLGTTNCKVAAFDTSGCLLGLVRQSIPTHESGACRAEQSVESWRDAITSGLRRIRQQVDVAGGEIVGLGLCGHWPSLALLDEHGKPVRPAILWKDRRGILPCGISPSDLARRIGLPEACVPALPFAKLLWLRDHEPESLKSARLHYCLGAKDTVAFWLTGQAVTDPVEAWWTGLAGRDGRQWDQQLLDTTGVPRRCMPQIMPVGFRVGEVLPDVAEETGLPAGVSVALGTGDGVCGALGGGLAMPGQGVVIVGSSIIVAIAVAPSQTLRQHNAIMRFPSPVGSCDLVYTSTPSGSAYAFMEGILGSERAREFCTSDLAWEAAPDWPLFVPHVEGIESPVVNAELRGAWLGLGMGHRLPELYHAVQEGIAFSSRHIVDALGELGIEVHALRLGGGGSEDRRSCQLFANALGRPVIKLAVADVGCLGAAVVSAVERAIYPDLGIAMRAMIREKEVIEPTIGNTVCEKRYMRFREACRWLNEWTPAKSGPF